MRYGLQESLQEFTAYVLGQAKTPFIPYQEDGNWEPYLPKFERQVTEARQETSGCTVFGALSQIETLHKRLYNEEPNYSERFTYLNVPVDPSRGTDPQATYETIRKHGLIDEHYLPMTDTLAEYLDASAITGSHRAKGQNWLLKYDFFHEWLWTRRPENYIEILREALKTSPIGVSVSAWNYQNGEYVSFGDVNNHYCLLYKIDEDGHPWVFDTYDNNKKKLSKDHNIRRAKRIWLNKRTKPAMRRHIKILTSIVKMLTNKQTLLDVCTAHLGTDASPNDLAPDELGCAETVTTLLKKIYPDTPIITGTFSLWMYLNNPRNGYERVTVPTPETIVVSPTGTGNPGTIGHAGIFMEDMTIASNDSRTGKFMKNYDFDTWSRRYVEKQGMKMHLFKHV